MSRDSDKYAALAELPWVRDGISPFERYAVSASESNAIKHLTEATLLSDAIFYGLLEKPWIKDDITVDEASAIGELVKIARGQWSNTDGDWTLREGNAEFALTILGMPFLDTFETLDYYTVRSLAFLHFVDNRYMEQVLDHPSFREGITDADTLILTGLWRIARFTPENMGNHLQMLDPHTLHYEQRTIETPLAGEISITLIGTKPDYLPSMETIEAIVRDQERFMDVAYPSNVTIFSVKEGVINAGNGIIILDPSRQEDLRLLAHELSHFYWSIPSTWSKGVIHIPFTWIVEGAARFMDQWATNRLEQAPGTPKDTGCVLVDTISEIDERTFVEDFESGSLYQSRCNYTMGYGIFAALYDELGDTEFRRGFGRLYMKIIHLEHDAECFGVERGVCYLRKAFIEDASPGFANAANEVIDRWYYGGQ